MNGQITGLDHGIALKAFSASCTSARVRPDLGQAFAYFGAIEAGALAAMMAKAKAGTEATDREPS